MRTTTSKAVECEICTYALKPQSPAKMVYRDGNEWQLMCAACYETVKKTWKCFKVQVVLEKWIYDESEETVLEYAKDDVSGMLPKKAKIDAAVIDEKPIKFSSEWDSCYERVKAALVAKDVDKALEILKELES